MILTIRAPRIAQTISRALGLACVLLALTGCDRLKQNNPAEAAKTHAQVKREQAACASSIANDRLKNAMFDAAIAQRNGDRAKLDVLADYSSARMEDPVVKGWDSALDITRCKSRFILEVPPGAERALAGERKLQADIDYTAQASADGAGFVYQLTGANPIVAKLAAFNLSPVAYRPPPAIDNAQAGVTQVAVNEAPPPRPPIAPQPPRPRVAVAQRGAPAAPPPPAPVRVAERAAPASAGGEATVRGFYGALGAGNGGAASSLVIPEKRASRAFSPAAISRFYGRLPERIRLTGITPTGGGAYRVSYRYSAGRSRCNGRAIVQVTNRGGRNLIRSIQSLSGC